MICTKSTLTHTSKWKAIHYMKVTKNYNEVLNNFNISAHVDVGPSFPAYYLLSIHAKRPVWLGRSMSSQETITLAEKN